MAHPKNKKMHTQQKEKEAGNLLCSSCVNGLQLSRKGIRMPALK
jgi:hypothetical protein